MLIEAGESTEASMNMWLFKKVRKGVTIIEAEACPDHIHMFVEILPKYSVAEIMGYLKGKAR